ncbi:MAG: hypothetical protein OEV40_08430 [Acidimicrobiia bacterium]|nr:hypothetical protein [Acidimicrobiia bacterium]
MSAIGIGLTEHYPVLLVLFAINAIAGVSGPRTSRYLTRVRYRDRSTAPRPLRLGGR